MDSKGLQQGNHERIAFCPGEVDWDEVVAHESQRKHPEHGPPTTRPWLYESAFQEDQCRTLVTGLSCFPSCDNFIMTDHSQYPRVLKYETS